MVTEDATELDPARRRVETTLRVQPTVWASYDGSVKATAALKGIVAQFDLIYKVRTSPLPPFPLSAPHLSYRRRNRQLPSIIHILSPFAVPTLSDIDPRISRRR